MPVKVVQEFSRSLSIKIMPHKWAITYLQACCRKFKARYLKFYTAFHMSSGPSMFWDPLISLHLMHLQYQEHILALSCVLCTCLQHLRCFRGVGVKALLAWWVGHNSLIGGISMVVALYRIFYNGFEHSFNHIQGLEWSVL